MNVGCFVRVAKDGTVVSENREIWGYPVEEGETIYYASLRSPENGAIVAPKVHSGCGHVGLKIVIENGLPYGVPAWRAKNRANTSLYDASYEFLQ